VEDFMQTHVHDDFRQKVKDTFVDLLENDQEMFYPLMQDIIEDIGLSKAMEEGELSPDVSEETILNMLKS
jgi:hypothetical protein